MKKIFRLIIAVLIVSTMMILACDYGGNKLGTCTVDCFVPNGGYDIRQFRGLTEEECKQKGASSGCPSRFCPPNANQSDCHQVYP